MLKSNSALVMLGKRNGDAALLRAVVLYLTAQPCVPHREDLGINDAWMHVTLMEDIELLRSTIYTLSRSSVKKGWFFRMVRCR